MAKNARKDRKRMEPDEQQGQGEQEEQPDAGYSFDFRGTPCRILAAAWCGEKARAP